jgi:hypothetical protein
VSTALTTGGLSLPAATGAVLISAYLLKKWGTFSTG